jgi:hypothetical protein
MSSIGMVASLRAIGRHAAEFLRTVFVPRRFALVLAAAGTLTAGALLPACAAAAVGKAPMIESVEASGGREVVLSASINPGGLASSYEIKLACAVCGPPGYAPATGELPAVQEPITVSLDLPGIKPGSYGFEVLARNAAGYALYRGELTVQESPPGALPGGLGGGEQYTPEVSPGALASAEAIAKQLFAEAEARRREERATEAKQAEEARRVALEAEEREAREAAARERREAEADHPACIVPALKGDTLTEARSVLAKAHCRLGRLHRLARRHGAARVLREGTRPGTHLGNGAPVALWLGVRHGGAKRIARGHQSERGGRR